MKKILAILSMSFVLPVQAQTPTPPPLKPYNLTWDRVADTAVKSYNIYKQVVPPPNQAWLYVSSVSQPVLGVDPVWIIPSTYPGGTVFSVTASNGNLESVKSSPATVPSAPISPANVRITITFP